MSRWAFARRLGTTALTLLFPEREACLGCAARLPGAPRGFGRVRLCPSCCSRVYEISGAVCRVCGKPDSGALCRDCRREPHSFFAARAYAQYDGVVEQLLKGLKYQGQKDALPLLGEWMTEGYLRQYGADRHRILTPVPMHASKLASRGFNQADELAAYVSKKLRLPLVASLARITPGSSQTVRTRAERIASLAGAFAVDERYRRRIEGQSMLLIDDILTTGGTADACAQVLFAAGAVSVEVLTVAR